MDGARGSSGYDDGGGLSAGRVGVGLQYRAIIVGASCLVVEREAIVIGSRWPGCGLRIWEVNAKTSE